MKRKKQRITKLKEERIKKKFQKLVNNIFASNIEF